ncbi:MAG TPA: hypothetical protein VN454_08335 [Candidatus Angelobacter sp.]|nr:hypothetical protein [Candidatus Angelobacter sp.]
MKPSHKLRKKNRQAGVALLIAIFSMLLIAAIAMALVVSAGTETSLAANYRATTGGYYAAVAGIEEARGRLLPSNPNTISTLAPLNGAYLPTNQVVYIVNPGIGETTGNVMAKYPDNQYAHEFSIAPTKTFINSVWVASNNNGPLYKWVRINAATKASLQINVDNTGLGAANNSTPLYFDTSLVPAAMVVPPVVGAVPAPTSTQKQAYEVTALAVTPNGSQKILQYVVTAAQYNINFNAALSLTGQVGNFQGANSNPYHVNGQDGSGSAPAVPGCTNNAATLPAIGVDAGLSGGNASQTNQQYVINSLPRPDHYIGAGAIAPAPSVSTITTTGALATPATLDQVIQTIQTNADAVIPNPPNPPNYNNSGTTYNFGGTGWPTDMSATNPKVVYVDGSFDLGPNTGYGLLVVTGNFHYHGNSGWKGVILVVGDGSATFDGQGGGNGEFDGAIFVATTRDASGNQLANFGTTNFDISGGGGNGIYYNSCWVSKVQQPPSYQVLSFREISQ